MIANLPISLNQFVEVIFLGSQYGSISHKKFSMIAIVVQTDKEGDGETSDEESSDEESSDEENESINITEDSEADDNTGPKSGLEVCSYESNK